MNDCYFDKKDWRSCKDEVSSHPARFQYFSIWHTVTASNKSRPPQFLSANFAIRWRSFASVGRGEVTMSEHKQRMPKIAYYAKSLAQATIRN